mgnify:CR=1 FL=1
MHFMNPIFTLTWKCPEFVQQLCRFLLAGTPLTYRYRLQRLGSLEERSHTSVPRPGRSRIGDQYGSHEAMGDHFIAMISPRWRASIIAMSALGGHTKRNSRYRPPT